MSGETAGGQGEVRIWAPHLRSDLPVSGQSPDDVMKAMLERSYRPRRIIQALGIALVSVLVFATIAHPAIPHLHLWLLGITWGIIGVVLVWSLGTLAANDSKVWGAIAQIWPSFVSTDDSGIAFVIGSDTISLQWGDVIGLRRMGYDRLTIYTRSSGTKTILLGGFSHRDVKSLTADVRAHANLSRRMWRAPDPRMELARGIAALSSRSHWWSRGPRIALFGCLFRLFMRSGPLYAGPGETLDSLAAAHAAKSLARPEDDTPSDPGGESGPDAAGLR